MLSYFLLFLVWPESGASMLQYSLKKLLANFHIIQSPKKSMFMNSFLCWFELVKPKYINICVHGPNI